jgi:hypothetical protein
MMNPVIHHTTRWKIKQAEKKNHHFQASPSNTDLSLMLYPPGENNNSE